MLNNYAKDYLGLVMPKLEVLYDVHWFSIFDDFSLVGFVESLQSYYHTLASLLDDKGTFPIESLLSMNFNAKISLMIQHASLSTKPP